MEVREAYDKVLGRVLGEYGLNHQYIEGEQYDFSYDFHQIVRVRESKKVIGIKIPFTRKTEIVAQIVSESKQANSQHTFSRLEYQGLEVHVVNSNDENNIRKVCEKLEEELNEPVNLIV